MSVAVVFMTGGVSWEGAMLDNEGLQGALRYVTSNDIGNYTGSARITF
jgi:hypothetical protein